MHHPHALVRRAAAVLTLTVLGLSSCAVPAATAGEAPTSPPDGFGMGLSKDLIPVAPSARGAVLAAPPASVDLTPWAPPPGDQGAIGSCVSWSVTYTAMGWYQRKDGIAGGTLAPMFAYAQIVKGRNTGTTFEANLRIATGQGIDPVSDYGAGSYSDYTTQPTAAQTTNAGSWKLSSWRAITTDPTSIKTSLAANKPVVLGMDVYDNFFRISTANGGYYDQVSGSLAGGHAVTALGYTDAGLRIENSWGTGWGDRGFATLSWDFVRSHVFQAIEIGPFTAAAPRAVTSTTSTTTTTAKPVTTTTAKPATTTTTTAKPVTTTTAKPVTTTTAKPVTTTTAKPVTTTTAPPSAKVTSVSPAAGPSSGGTTVTISGSNLAGASVTFGATAVPPTVNAAGTTVTVRAPAGVGSAPIKVTARGATVQAGTWTWTGPPTVTSLSTATGSRTKATTVTLRGSGFTTTTTKVFVGGLVLTPRTASADGTSMTVSIPPMPPTRTVMFVFNASGTSDWILWTWA